MRAMTLKAFEKKFEPLRDGQGITLFDHIVARLHPDDRVWTMLDCDGKVYLAPGWHHINRTGDYVITKNPWKREDYSRDVKW